MQDRVTQHERDQFRQLVSAIRYQVRSLEVEADDGPIMPDYVAEKADIASYLLRQAAEFARRIHGEPPRAEEGR